MSNRNKKPKRRMRGAFVYAAGIIVLTAAVALYVNHTYAAKKQTIIWPTEQWKATTPEEEGMSSETLGHMFDDLSSANVHSVLVARHGRIVLEAYNKDTKAETKQNVLSVTKSVTSALTGIAIAQGKIGSVDQPIEAYYANLASEDARKAHITIKNLLTMTSGIAWSNENEASSKEMIASPDWVQYVLDRPMDADPGTKFMYSNGSPHVLSDILLKTTGMNEEKYAEQRLFQPLGITDYSWEKDPQGRPYGSFGLHLTTRDMAKFGLLYLQNGKWDGKTVVPKEWVTASTTQYVGEDHTDGTKRGYGYLWWLRNEGGKPSPGDPAKYDMYSAVGSGGQRIVVVPKYDMVIVFTADNSDAFFADRLIDTYILASVNGSKPLEQNADSQRYLNGQIAKFGEMADTAPGQSNNTATMSVANPS